MEDEENSTHQDQDQALQKKHQLMLERLSARHQTRLETRKPDSPESSATSAFLSRFNDSKKSIDAQLESASDPSRLVDISFTISDLEKLVAENSYLLPSYEIRSSLKTISDLKQSLDNLLKNCKIYAGPVVGSILMEEVEDCVFVLASHQIRIHFAKRSDFYLRVRSRPIIEDSDGLRFAPYCLKYEGIGKDLAAAGLDEETGNWANVDDFKWLRAVQSPNWSVLPEEERVGAVDLLLRAVQSPNWSVLLEEERLRAVDLADSG
ncbi:hypothetical protein JRO89_XS13G0237000 [Xanthoceras sorbifolium]|uniref:C-CAP/cofactor C-like domain-containing protein n=1 Tax=Xanthoceras sorbifolium TaxID=99658 RepID=A0ABQ8H9Q7_9ROSI|nr:hypothetical protein JRO89_XS13G0237000 [Xanthoceras sorbifolium]